MTPKEKAKQLVNKFLQANQGHFYQVTEADDLDAAKECALVLVNEIIEIKGKDSWMGVGDRNDPRYWNEVKQEIENL